MAGCGTGKIEKTIKNFSVFKKSHLVRRVQLLTNRSSASTTLKVCDPQIVLILRQYNIILEGGLAFGFGIILVSRVTTSEVSIHREMYLLKEAEEREAHSCSEKRFTLFLFPLFVSK